MCITLNVLWRMWRSFHASTLDLLLAYGAPRLGKKLLTEPAQ